ncbi:MAG TPA: response regulator transcription factor, partial [Thermoanaerobaculia bacterium]|nr:response regulator transcription factor [Thermoanaerobaculia bacterium]
MGVEAGGAGRPARVLIVDDHPVFRAGLVQVLDGEPGLAVCGQAGSAEEALGMLDAQAPDLLVIDISLGGASGLELVKQVRQRRPGLPML